MSREGQAEAPAGDAAVAETLAELRAAVRRRQAELATLEEDLERLPASVAAVERTHRLAEPSWTGEGTSGWVLRLQKIAYHLVAKRPHRSLLRQQTEFNRSVSLALRDLAERQRALAESLRELAAAESARDADG